MIVAELANLLSDLREVGNDATHGPCAIEREATATPHGMAAGRESDKMTDMRNSATLYRPVDGRVLVWMPFERRRNNRELLNSAGRGTNAEWDKENRRWTVSRTAFTRVLDALLEEFGTVNVVTDGRARNRCDIRCREAVGDECVCECAGRYHGSKFVASNEQIVGETTIVGEGEFTRWTRIEARGRSEARP